MPLCHMYTGSTEALTCWLQPAWLTEYHLPIIQRCCNDPLLGEAIEVVLVQGVEADEAERGALYVVQVRKLLFLTIE